jgi:alanine racemase
LQHNLQVVRDRLVQASPSPVHSPNIWAVIKANAYGHGIERALQGFQAADGLAMLDMEEALRCRHAGWQKPILMLEGFFDESDLALCASQGLTAVVHDPEQIRLLQSLRLSADMRPLKVFLKLNTGMNRLGFGPDRFRQAYEQLSEMSQDGKLAELGTMTHFACADEPGGMDAPLAVFLQATRGLVGPVSLANSAAVFARPALMPSQPGRLAWVRPGICLYGGSPFAEQKAAGFGLEPAMTLSSRIIGVQSLSPGQSVGYGYRFTADRSMRIGVVACGYADGFPRHAPDGTPVNVAGGRTRLIGRVSMDMLTVDLTDLPQAGVGSPVVLWGKDGPSVDEVAQASGTIGYELLCAIAQRVRVLSTE